MKPLAIDRRTQRLVMAVAAGVVGRVAALIAPLLAMPAMLHYFGDADFGIWATGISITNIAVFADLGIGNGLLTRIATAYGKEDHGDIRRYLSSAYVTLGIVGCALFVLSTIGFAFFDRTNSVIIFCIFGVFSLGLPAAVVHRLLYGLQRVPTSNFLVVVGAALSVSACLFAIHLKAPVWTVVIAYGLPPVLVALAGASVFFRRHPEFRPSVHAVQWPYAADLARLGSGFFALSILTAIGLNADNLIIAANSGAAAVAAYAIPYRLGSVLGLLIMTLFMPLWGANGEALAKGEYAWVSIGARRMSLLGLLIVVVGGGLLLTFSDTIIRLWVGRSFPDQHLILASVIATSAVIAATSPYNMVLNALGKATVQIWPWLAFVLISVPLKFAVAAPERVWPVAALTGIVYVLIVTPAVIIVARRNLARPTGR